MTSPDLVDGGRFARAQLGPGHGDNMAPRLHWQGAPEDTAGFALTLRDDDAPDYVHFLALLGPAAAGHDPSHTDASLVLGQGTRLLGYEGPCPPEGTHHYRFTLRALSKLPTLGTGFDAATLEAAIDGSVLATATLEATYDAGLVRALRLRGGRALARLRGGRVGSGAN